MVNYFTVSLSTLKSLSRLMNFLVILFSLYIRYWLFGFLLCCSSVISIHVGSFCHFLSLFSHENRFCNTQTDTREKPRWEWNIFHYCERKKQMKSLCCVSSSVRKFGKCLQCYLCVCVLCDDCFIRFMFIFEMERKNDSIITI